MLEGTYSVDGGEWQTIDNNKTIESLIGMFRQALGQ